MTRHYLDHASTSPLRPEAASAMRAWLDSGPFADPGRLHAEGRSARHELEQARQGVAELLGTAPRQVVFTSGGTEAIATAVWGAANACPGGTIVLADVEHSAVREASRRAGPVVVVDVDGLGRIEPAAVGDALERSGRRGVALVHCQLANHEVGTLQPVEEVVALCRSRGVPVHVDACAAAGHVPLDVDELGADLVSVSAHKMGGPPGIGALVVRRGLRIAPLLLGGEQERGRRAGLENLPAAAGFGACARLLAEGAMDAEARRSARHGAALREAVLGPGVHDLGDPEHRLPHLVCVAIEDVEAEPVLLGLDQAGFAVHSGSSCASEALAPSPVLQAMGADAERSLRISVGWSTSDDDVSSFAQVFPAVLARLRALRA